ncbi:glutamine synthetase family protein [Streptomyces sp. NBC_01808]|uniref:glutamine synthetase family protein n=1 Tax=Streptomyces sp. NBC_01808 TaxID=2975947 RepID=UPI002DD7F8B5|nr:glutamine synthetase family protein [Streptomyces sp. NBC_01808]WSA41150.1 glutamine synthetase family protein [Streptomyces sp. NBC_01808]
MTVRTVDGAASVDRAMAAMSEAGVRLIALSWVDNAGIGRVKTVPLARLPRLAVHGVGMSPVFDTFLVDDSMARTDGYGGPVGDLLLLPDLNRLTRLAAQPGWAWAPADRYSQDGERYPGCHRSFVNRMVRAAAGQGLSLRMGFETEWSVGPGALGEGPAYGLARLADSGAYLLDIVDALTAQGVEVLQIHPEYEPGQFEISTVPEAPLDAADTAVLVRHTVRAVSHAHGLRASFAPLPGHSGIGNGGHVHLSLWRGEKNLMHGGTGPRGMTPDGEAFLAGLLRSLPALTGVGCPSPASYLRLAPSSWSGAYRCWGWENREAALRFITGPAGEAAQRANAELKCFDQAANPYLVVGSVIAAGLAGREDALRLPEEFTDDPAHADPGELAQRGIERLPTGLAEAVRHLRGSVVLRKAMGDHLFDALLAVRGAEDGLFADRSRAETVDATRRRY